MEVVACVSADGMPTASMSFSIAPSGLKPLNVTGRFSLLCTKIPYIPIAIEIAWERLEAIAAPSTPSPNPKINRGSRAITQAPPTSWLIIGKVIFPDPCSTENDIWVKILPKARRETVRMYVTPAAITS